MPYIGLIHNFNVTVLHKCWLSDPISSGEKKIQMYYLSGMKYHEVPLFKDALGYNCWKKYEIVSVTDELGQILNSNDYSDWLNGNFTVNATEDYHIKYVIEVNTNNVPLFRLGISYTV